MSNWYLTLVYILPKSSAITVLSSAVDICKSVDMSQVGRKYNDLVIFWIAVWLRLHIKRLWDAMSINVSSCLLSRIILILFMLLSSRSYSRLILIETLYDRKALKYKEIKVWHKMRKNYRIATKIKIELTAIQYAQSHTLHLVKVIVRIFLHYSLCGKLVLLFYCLI